MRRLYLLVPNVRSAKEIINILLLKKVCYHNMHAVAKQGVDISQLPEAGIMIQKDVIHSLYVGACVGSMVGVVAGLIAHGILDLTLSGSMLVITILGGLLGAWSASMFGLMTPNIHLKRFQSAIEDGHILLIIDIPKNKVKEIEQCIRFEHPDIEYAGMEPTIPRFP